MAMKFAQSSLQALFKHITSQLTTLVTAEVTRRVQTRLEALRPPPRAAEPAPVLAGGRLCPVPGCGKAGKGPRNRYFCTEHAKALSVDEQRSIVLRNKRLAAEGKAAGAAKAVPAGPRFTRLPSPKPRVSKPLDMSCRVEGCTNRSRGPRAGFICDPHRLELTPEEQASARAAWNARKKAGPVAPPPAPVLVQAVPPIVRKPDPVAQGAQEQPA